MAIEPTIAEAALSALPEESQDNARIVDWCIRHVLRRAHTEHCKAAEAAQRVNDMLAADFAKYRITDPLRLADNVGFTSWSIEVANPVGTRYRIDSFEELHGWRRLDDLPSFEDLNRFLAKRPSVDRATLINASDALDEYKHYPSHFCERSRMVHGLTFCAPSGSILITFPSDWPETPQDRYALLYLMGETTAADYSNVVRKLHESLESLLLPVEAHAADGG